MNDNPYAAPSMLPETSPLATIPPRTLRWVLAFATALLLMAGLALAYYGWVTAVDVYRVVSHGERLWRTADSLAGMALAATLILSQLSIVIGAWKMLRLRSRRWAIAAGWLSVVPVLSPFCILGIPLGIGALIVLYRADVKAAFRHAADERESLRRAANH